MGQSLTIKAEQKNKLKYSHLSGHYSFVPIGIETFGSFGKEARQECSFESFAPLSHKGDKYHAAEMGRQLASSEYLLDLHEETSGIICKKYSAWD